MPAGEWVNASTSSGYAIALDAEPADDSSWPDCSRTKSRLRRSGTSDIAPTIATSALPHVPGRTVEMLRGEKVDLR